MLKQVFCFLTLLFLLCNAADAKNIEDLQANRLPEITDSSLQNCISQATKKPFKLLTRKDYLKVKALSCKKKNIHDISGIENLSNLSVLNLITNPIEDINPLAKLPQLTELYLWHNHISDISPLEKLTKLKKLHLWGNKVNNLHAISELVQLEELLLGDNQIVDITPLANLPKLSLLELENNNIDNVSPLKKLAKLTNLNLSKNNVNDLEPFLNLKGLISLYLQNNKIDDISPLADLPSLEILFLGQNKISDISPLANLPGLRILNLDNNLISDLNPLSDSKKLAQVSLLNNCIKNFAVIGNVKKITGTEYQHHLCDKPNLVKRNITKEWLGKKIKEQCIDYGENQYSLKKDYDFYPDGLYYNFYKRMIKNDKVQKLVCKIPWNGEIADFVNTLERIKSKETEYTIYEYNKDYIYVQNNLIKGYSINNRRKVNGKFSILKDIKELFQQTYILKEGTSANQFIGKGKEHILRIIDKGDNYDLQYFEPHFFEKEIISER